MAASYPGAIKTFTSKTDKEDLYQASHINDLQDEVNAIETELGTDVAGSKTDLKTRLSVSLADSGALAQGTAYPGSPVIGQPFYRTDTDTWNIYDGASWDNFGGGLPIKSVTNLSTSSNSGDITIEASKIYFVTFEFSKATDGELMFRVNSDATSVYDYYNEERDLTTGTVTAASGTATRIDICSPVDDAGYVNGWFILNTVARGGLEAFMYGQGMFDDAANASAMLSFGGTYNNTSPTSFEMLPNGGTLTGNIYLYEFVLTA